MTAQEATVRELTVGDLLRAHPALLAGAIANVGPARIRSIVSTYHQVRCACYCATAVHTRQWKPWISGQTRNKEGRPCLLPYIS